MQYAYEEKGYIKICGAMKKESLNTYVFTCPYCNTTLLIGTDFGRYGNVGPFACQKCSEEFYATDNDCLHSVLHIFKDKTKLFDLTCREKV